MALLLAPYAVSEMVSRGREYAEPRPRDGRSEFARDRDRITHSDSFKRLQGKTQVFTDACQYHGSVKSAIIYTDHFRNRLTHSLEVAQVSRSLSRQLNLNEDLVETLAYAHDLGHAPFGHIGQDVLNEKMSEFGGFEHNIQSLRTVTKLESKYSEFSGLNLMFETREGILKHCSLGNAGKLGDVASRFLNKTSPTLEAQVTDLGDAIAYTCHDIEDGIKSGLITPQTLMPSSLFSRSWNSVGERKPGLTLKYRLQETLRELMGTLIKGVITQTRYNIEKAELLSLDDVRERGHDVVSLPSDLADEHKKLKSLMFRELYQHPIVVETKKDADLIITKLFDTYMSSPNLMQHYYETDSQKALARQVADYISGMTDRYAYKAYEAALRLNDAAYVADLKIG